MTHASNVLNRRVEDLVDDSAPAERLAAFRILLGVFVTGYFALRLPVFLELRDRSADRFDAVGLFRLLDRPLSRSLLIVALVVAVVAGVAFACGWHFRLTGPTFAITALVLTTYRSSWGQLLHFENLFVLLVLVVGFSRAADAWSLDARHRPVPRPGVSYGWPLQLCCLVVVTTYAIAGIAKLQLGGWEWVVGDTIRHHVAYASVRLELLGAHGSPLAGPAVRHAWLFTPMAAATLVIELSAPLVLWWRRARWVWCLAAWAMHVGIFALMLIGFPTPLFGVAFAPFFATEQPVQRAIAAWRGRRRMPLRSAATGPVDVQRSV